jgi:hypothetical protein
MSERDNKPTSKEKPLKPMPESGLDWGEIAAIQFNDRVMNWKHMRLASLAAGSAANAWDLFGKQTFQPGDTFSIGTRTQLPWDRFEPHSAKIFRPSPEVAQLKERIEKSYPIKLLADGDSVTEQRDAANDYKPNGHVLYAREGTKDELLALEQALAKSRTSLPSKYQPKMRIAFLKEQLYVNRSSPSLAHHFSSLDGAPLVTIEVEGRKSAAVEETFVHEFSHQSQDKLWSLGGVPKEIQDKLGWEKGYTTTAANTWNLSLRLKMKDGSGLCNAEQYSIKQSQWRWVQCPSAADIVEIAKDPNGKAARLFIKDGKVNADLDKSVDYSFARKNALVPPPSDYFINPTEEHAEALTNFRLSQTTRLQLLKTSPTLYEVAKSDDQRDIDMIYPRIHGEPQYVRMPNGLLTKNDQSAQDTVKQFEASANATTRSGTRGDKKLTEHADK